MTISRTGMCWRLQPRGQRPWPYVLEAATTCASGCGLARPCARARRAGTSEAVAILRTRRLVEDDDDVSHYSTTLLPTEHMVHTHTLVFFRAAWNQQHLFCPLAGFALASEMPLHTRLRTPGPAFNKSQSRLPSTLRVQSTPETYAAYLFYKYAVGLLYIFIYFRLV